MSNTSFAPEPKKKSTIKTLREKANTRFRDTAYPWLIPLSILLIAIFLYPIFEIIRISFTDMNLVEQDFSYTFNSYIQLFSLPGFWPMLGTTGFFVFFSVAFQLLCGFVIALLIVRGEGLKLRGTVIVRTSVLVAWAIPGVVIGVIFTMLYDETSAGILNHFLSQMGIGPVTFLSDPTLALLSVTLANIWRGTAFSMILMYAGLQTVSKQLVEAAKIDGAGAFQRLRNVILPTITPIILVNLIIISIDTFNTFDMVMALTQGGPGSSTEVIALSIYNTIFQEFNLGVGAATSIILLLINISMTMIYLKVLGKKGDPS
ncbi:multiple sugar transport system permease protein [Geomicrobium halophilum]|uniref:Multiple sugar transport system permease protein n=1 Tax=Geomicrobium halophilum TaxID=549000 RepID=A0A841Q057_9BACL|nr:sugar ABC transporter permease [Geomicrobium halophilum]MBB6450883.1 multiple sugar transport system permease protein [Geomicrobium halophilum]